MNKLFLNQSPNPNQCPLLSLFCIVKNNMHSFILIMALFKCGSPYVVQKDLWNLLPFTFNSPPTPFNVIPSRLNGIRSSHSQSQSPFCTMASPWGLNRLPHSMRWSFSFQSFSSFSVDEEQLSLPELGEGWLIPIDVSCLYILLPQCQVLVSNRPLSST